jgi:mRNA interferase RelE/StbE
MANYEVVFRESIAKDLRAIPNKDVARILQRINELAQDPRPPGSEKLTGEEKYRIRQGNYRILYTIDDEIVTVTVVKIGHRRDVYRQS